MLVGVFVLGMFVYHMLKGVCGCKLVEGIELAIEEGGSPSPSMIGAIQGTCVRKDSGLKEGNCNGIIDRVNDGDSISVRASSDGCHRFPECIWATKESARVAQNEVSSYTTCDTCVDAGYGWRDPSASVSRGCGTAKGGDPESPCETFTSLQDCPNFGPGPIRCNWDDEWRTIDGVGRCIPYPLIHHRIADKNECQASTEFIIQETINRLTSGEDLDLNTEIYNYGDENLIETVRANNGDYDSSLADINSWNEIYTPLLVRPPPPAEKSDYENCLEGVKVLRGRDDFTEEEKNNAIEDLRNECKMDFGGNEIQQQLQQQLQHRLCLIQVHNQYLRNQRDCTLGNSSGNDRS
jgi:hypothetical protein